MKCTTTQNKHKKS